MEANTIQGNFIGTDIGGTVNLGNSGAGVFIDGASGNTIADNTIAFNGSSTFNTGVAVLSGTNNDVRRNLMYQNASLGIDLGDDGLTANDPGDPDAGPNQFQNFPEISLAIDDGTDLVVIYQVPSAAPNSTFPLSVEFFLADVDGQEGQTFLGADSYGETDGVKTVSLSAIDVNAGDLVVATATDANGNTSEFSVSVAVAGLDFGDAPDPVDATSGKYPTLLASGGARHGMVAGGPLLGLVPPDAEADGQPEAGALGDDNDAEGDDEDAIDVSSVELIVGQATSLSLPHHGGEEGAFVNAWIDFNRDGDWDDTGEQIVTDLAVPAGASSTELSIDVPSNAVVGNTFARFRISTQAGLGPTGLAPDGEVEDYEVEIEAVTCGLVVDHTADDGQRGSLREAIICANSTPEADTINVSAGTYVLDLVGAGENAAAFGDLDITEELTIVGAGAATTVIDASGLDPDGTGPEFGDRVFHVHEVTFKLQNVTITGGNLGSGDGGGLLNELGSVTLTDSIVGDNATTGSGGGLATSGGAVAGTLILIDTVVSDNLAGGGGGGVFSRDDTLNLAGSTIRDNEAKFSGGGILITTATSGMTLDMIDSTVAGNQTSGDGGGIAGFRETLVIIASTISGNTAAGAGGGVTLDAAELTLTNGTVSGNTAGTFGGGIHVPTGAMLTSVNNTIVDNVVGISDITTPVNGGGIFSEGATLFHNTILFGNKDVEDTPTEYGGGAAADPSSSFNLIGIDAGMLFGIADGVNGNRYVADARLGPLQDNGGPTFTHALLENSPALDTADTALAPATDQRGVARPFGPAADIGAFESTMERLADLSLEKSVDKMMPNVGDHITFTIVVDNSGDNDATGVEVTDLLPAGLMFVEAIEEQGDYDEASGLWNVGSLAAEATTTLTITATVDTEDPLTNTAEVTAADQFDSDSTPGNNISTEDDQFFAGVGLCLTGGPLQIGTNRLIYSCATPGSFSAFVRGTELGSFFFARYNTTVEVADPEVLAISIANIDGIAVILFDITQEQANQSFTFQAFEMNPNHQLSNTLTLQAPESPLLATEVGLGAVPLDANVLPGLLNAASARWEVTGLSSRELAALASVTLSVSDLPDGIVGATIGDKVLLDLDAAGNGWFVDVTPWDDAEFVLDPDSHQMRAVASGASGQLDALTVVMHELGHVLGLPDLPAGMGHTHLMQQTLAPGLRRLPVSHTNWRLSEDVNGDGTVSPIDALLVINVLNGEYSWSVDGLPELKSETGQAITAYLDTNRDYYLSPSDVLRVINYLNRPIARGAEGEDSSNAGSGDRTLTTGSMITDAIFSLDHQQWGGPVERAAKNDKIPTTAKIEPGWTSAQTPTSKSHRPLRERPQVLMHLPEVELLIDELADDVLLGWNSLAS